MHMAAGAVVNAAWDLAAKLAGRPVWEFLAGMTPEELVSLVDFRYLSDALTPDEALEILRAAEPGRAERAARLRAEGTRRTPPRPVGWATATTSWSDWPRRPSPTASPRSS